jgi:hypothetical protein
MNPLLAQRSISELEAGVAVGQGFGGRKEFQQAVLALFVRRGEGIRFKKWRSDTGRAEVGCAQKKMPVPCWRQASRERLGRHVERGGAHVRGQAGGRGRRQSTKARALSG